MSRGIALCVALLSASHGAMAADIAAPGLEGIVLEDLQATRALPLFSPTRQLPEPAIEVVVAKPPTVETRVSSEAFLLVGVVLSDSSKVALLRDSQTGIVTRVASGSNYGDWTLTVLGPRQISLEGRGENIVRSLFQGAGEAAPSDGGDDAETQPAGLWR